MPYHLLGMSEQTKNPDLTQTTTQIKNGKITSNDSVSKRSVAAIFPNQEAAEDAVTKLKAAGFNQTEIEFTPEQLADKGSYMVLVHAGERAVIALEVLVNAGGDTNTNQPEQLAQQAEQAETAEDPRTLPRKSAGSKT